MIGIQSDIVDTVDKHKDEPLYLGRQNNWERGRENNKKVFSNQRNKICTTFVSVTSIIIKSKPHVKHENEKADDR